MPLSTQAATRLVSICWALALMMLSAGLSPKRRIPAVGAGFRVMTYNIHHGEGIDGKVDVHRIARVILEQGADVVALQEVDRGVTRRDGRDLIRELAELTRMNFAFGKDLEFQGGDYGNALLSRFPIVVQDNYHYAMLRRGEQRGLHQALLNIQGGSG